MAKQRQKLSRRRQFITPHHTPFVYPAVSVIIAMYNTEKYIGECLDSILVQTFQNFEVIVVDDCSTDNSVAVVQNYMPRFGGRLKVIRLKKNSGNNGIPNNIGLSSSHGEYVLFMDSDDTITADALEKLYVTAKNYNADVVGCEKYYDVPEKFWYDAEFRNQLKPSSYQQGDFVSEPTLITDDFSVRTKDCAQKKFLWNIWSKLIRRDFLVENKISITNEMANDMLLSCFLIFSAKRYVRVPYVINFYRVVESSLTHQKRDPAKQFKKYITALTVGFSHLDEFLSDREFFIQHPDVKYLALEIYYREIIGYLLKIYAQVPVHQLDEILREEFSAGNNVALAAFSFNMANIHQLQHIRNLQQFNQFAAQAQNRIAELENEIKRLKTKE